MKRGALVLVVFAAVMFLAFVPSTSAKAPVSAVLLVTDTPVTLADTVSVVSWSAFQPAKVSAKRILFKRADMVRLTPATVRMLLDRGKLIAVVGDASAGVSVTAIKFMADPDAAHRLNWFDSAAREFSDYVAYWKNAEGVGVLVRGSGIFSETATQAERISYMVRILLEGQFWQ